MDQNADPKDISNSENSKNSDQNRNSNHDKNDLYTESFRCESRYFHSFRFGLDRIYTVFNASGSALISVHLLPFLPASQNYFRFQRRLAFRFPNLLRLKKAFSTFSLLSSQAIQRLSFPPAFKQSASTRPVLFVGIRVNPWLKLAFQSALICVICGYAFSATPTWWTTQQVLDTTKSPKDYAVVNQGQLKTIAKKAITEMNAKLPGGAGTELNALLTTWATANATRNDYQAVNIGQVKALAKKFYDRLNAVGQTTAYPWSTATTDDKDYAAANIGQVKNAFSFAISGTVTLTDRDNDGLSDAWEMQYFGNFNQTATGDFDNDGVNNLTEYLQGRNPTKGIATNPTVTVDLDLFTVRD